MPNADSQNLIVRYASLLQRVS